MPKGVFNWSAEDAIRFLKKRGFALHHSRGSHLYYVRREGGDVFQVCIPFHGGRALKPRTLKGIIQQSGISKGEWLGS